MATPHVVTPNPAGSTFFDDLGVGELLSADAVNKIKNNGVVQVENFDVLASLPLEIKVAYVGATETNDALKESLYFRGLAGNWAKAGYSVYDTGWVINNLSNGDVFLRRVDYTVFFRGTVTSASGSVTDIIDLGGTDFAPEHPVSISAHYDVDKTISNPVYNEGTVFKVNSQNGEAVTFSGSWSVTSLIPGTATNVINLSAEPSDTSVVLTWEVE